MIAGFKAKLDALSPAERGAQAAVTMHRFKWSYQDDQLADVHDPDSAPLVQLNPAFFDQRKPATAPQIVTVCIPGIQGLENKTYERLAGDDREVERRMLEQRTRDAVRIRDHLDWAALEAHGEAMRARRRWVPGFAAAAWLAVMTLAAPLAPRQELHAQNPPRMQIPGMPDLSSAPADVQAIWKKVIGGGRPTEAEAKRLSDWMTANKDKIAAATTKGLQAQQQAMGGPTLGGHDGQPACPTKVALPPSLALIPTAAGAAALLDSIKASYTARLTPAGAQVIRKLLTQVNDPGNSVSWPEPCS